MSCCQGEGQKLENNLDDLIRQSRTVTRPAEVKKAGVVGVKGEAAQEVQVSPQPVLHANPQPLAPNR